MEAIYNLIDTLIVIIYCVSAVYFTASFIWIAGFKERHNQIQELKVAVQNMEVPKNEYIPKQCVNPSHKCDSSIRATDTHCNVDRPCSKPTGTKRRTTPTRRAV